MTEKEDPSDGATRTIVVPTDVVDGCGQPGSGNERERVTVTRNRQTPGVEVWRAEHSLRYWRVFHEGYSFCTCDPNWRGLADWRYRRMDFAMSATAQQVFEPGGAHHTFRVDGPPAFFHVLLIQPDEVARLLGREPPHLYPFSDDPSLQVKLRQACLNVRAGLDQQSIDASLIDYLNHLFDSLGEQPPPSDRLKPKDWRVNRVLEMINDGYAEDLKVKTLADAVGLSPSRLVSLFGKCTSLPVHRYLVTLRLAKARRLIANGVRPSVAALDCGFYDRCHLRREMKAHFGFTPSHYFAAGRSKPH